MVEKSRTVRWGKFQFTEHQIERQIAEATRRGVLHFEHEDYRFGDQPPAYHDEFSYAFQAKTYLAKRLSSESHPTVARLFDQMHVVNEGRFASRYFPASCSLCWRRKGARARKRSETDQASGNSCLNVL